MRFITFLFLLTVGLSSIIAVTVNETDTKSSPEHDNDHAVTATANATETKGRHLEEVVQPSKKTKRQVIKIPGTVSKVKIVQPPLNLKHNRAPQQFSRFPPNLRSGGMRKPPMRKYQRDSSFAFDPNKVKRNYKKPSVRSVTPEGFYNEEGDFEEKFRPKKMSKYRSMVKVKRKRAKQNVSGEFYNNYNHEDNSETEESRPFHTFDSSGSVIRMQQQSAAPSFFPRATAPASMDNAFAESVQRDGNYVPGMMIKKLPAKGRQVQSMFAQQYTTHNPHVTTNFGLNEALQQKRIPYTSVFPHLEKYSQPIAASSDHVVTSLPINTPGIQLIQPPQFSDGTGSHSSHPSRLMSTQLQKVQKAQNGQKEDTSPIQRATMRDILDHDCPSHDGTGYCDSPPRYPMQQIKNIVKKCLELMNVMNTQPFDEPQELKNFAKRADNHLDNNNNNNNNSISVDLGVGENHSSWSRLASEEQWSACKSDVQLIEPGYAKEVNSGRWFVIVQDPDTTIQRIATDTCRSPGKPCGGFSDLKCAKGKGTRCLQRRTNQRLISWDPESPEECPRMRVFRFPSACTCHLNVL